jgi:glucosamine 6-phosphate synthetase-like amidotransferase/phosphosugar isomerase protein
LSGNATLASVETEFEKQPSLLESFRKSMLWSELVEKGDPVLVGAGDSYAASLCTSFLSGPKVLALDPLSLAESIGRAKDRPVYIVSISGETATNIDLARALKGVASRTVAVTSNPGSRLASETGDIILLPFRSAGKSPGIATFTLSLAALLRICGHDPKLRFEDAMSAATKSRGVLIARGEGVTHYAGNNEDYAASIYGVAKIYELLGRRAQASMLEEFSHMPLFSLAKSDTVNVIESVTGNKGLRLCSLLKKNGYRSSLIRLKGGRIQRLYSLVFAMQIAAIRAAKSEGLKAPYFLGAKEKLRISDAMIY